MFSLFLANVVCLLKAAKENVLPYKDCLYVNLERDQGNQVFPCETSNKKAVVRGAPKITKVSNRLNEGFHHTTWDTHHFKAERVSALFFNSSMAKSAAFQKYSLKN